MQDFEFYEFCTRNIKDSQEGYGKHNNKNFYKINRKKDLKVLAASVGFVVMLFAACIIFVPQNVKQMKDKILITGNAGGSNLAESYVLR